MTIDYGFDTKDVEISSEALPAGEYKVVISGEEIHEPKDPGKANCLKLTYEVIEGESRGRLISQYLNIWHANELPRKIAQETLKKIAKATGKDINQDSPAKGRFLTIKVRQQKDNSEYTEVHGYSAA